MKCNTIKDLLSDWRVCEEREGQVIINTDCLYPSFEQAKVGITERRGLFEVSDIGGAVASVLSHGKEGKALDSALSEATRRHCLTRRGDCIVVSVESLDWLPAAILSVANASALAARTALIDEEQTAKEVLFDEIDRSLVSLSQEMVSIRKEFIVRRDYFAEGRSGKRWKFDFAVKANKQILIKTVSPHGNSVNANFVAFSDMEANADSINLCVYSKEPNAEDVRLLNQVASVVPLRGLAGRVSSVVSH